MSTSHSTWLDSNRIVMFYKIWFVYVMFWYLPWCVSDSVLVGIWQFSNRKINFYYTLFSFLFSCSLIFWYICRASFYRFLTEHRTSLGTSSPPATSVSLDNTLTYADFVLATLNNLFLLTYISLGANNFLFLSYLCLGCQFLAHSVFYATHLCLFSRPYSLFPHHS